MSHRLRIEWTGRSGPHGGKPSLQDNVSVFNCDVVDGRLVIPPEAQRLIGRKHPNAVAVRKIEWLDGKPEGYKCGAKTEEEAEEISAQVNAEADLAMKILEGTEPEPQPSVEDLIRMYGPNGPVEVIGRVEGDQEVFDGRCGSEGA